MKNKQNLKENGLKTKEEIIEVVILVLLSSFTVLQVINPIIILFNFN